MNIHTENRNFEFSNYDVDKMLYGTETRVKNKYFDNYKVNILCAGSSGSGKTTFLIKMLLNNIFEQIDCVIICIPEESFTSGIYATLAKNNILNRPILFCILNRYDKKEVTELNEDEEIYIICNGFITLSEMAKIKKQLGIQKPVIIFDDYVTLLNKQEDWNQYYRYVHNGSRLNADIVSCVQSINKIPPNCRSSYLQVILFTNYLTKSVLTTLLRNCVNNPMLDKKNTETLLEVIAEEPNKHEPLIILSNTDDPKKSIIFKNKYIYFD